MRKGLNNKGFTLVELLAVVVILALVMGIAASSMLSTMNSSRKSTLYSAAQTAAASLNSWVADELLATTAADRKLGTHFINNTQGSDKAGTWICIDDASVNILNYNADAEDDSTKRIKLTTALGISTEDIVTDGTAPTSGTTYSITEGDDTPANNTCSAIRYNTTTGGYEVLLVASSEGKYYVPTDDKHYAFSRAKGPNLDITD